MTLRLILIRHAKSSWDDFDLEDHDRPLNERGQIGADAIGVWMAEQGFSPDVALISSAARTIETWDRIQTKKSGETTVNIRETLYHSSPDRILMELQKANGNTVAIVAHNPGIAAFADGIVDVAPSHSRFGAYPTGATLVVDFPFDTWAKVQPNTGRVVNFVVPRDFTRASVA